MANELRSRTNFVGGLVEDNPLTNVATTLNSAGLAALPVIDTTNHAALILDPDGIHGAPEIVHVTAHSASSTTATILRAQESTSARQHLRDTYWVHTATVRDFDSEVMSAKIMALAPYSVPNATEPAYVDFDSVQQNESPYADSEWWDSGNAELVTIPADGLYLIIAQISYETNTTGGRWLRIDKVGTGILAQTEIPSSGVGYRNGRMNISVVDSVTAGDQYRLYTYQNSGSGLNTSDPTFIQATRLKVL